MSTEYPGVFVEEAGGVPPSVSGVDTSIAAFVGHTVKGATHAPTPVHSFSEFEETFGGLSAKCPISYSVRDYFTNGGRRAYVVRVAASATGSQIIGNRTRKLGLYALEKIDAFNLLIIPEITSNIAAQAEAIAYCESRRAFMIIDVPAAVMTVAQVSAWISSATSLQSSNAAFYFPSIKEVDALTGVTRAFPASGAIAGVFARTDKKSGVWKAPAGIDATVIGAVGVAVAINDQDNNVLNALGVNCVREFPARGVVNWGSRTARGGDAMNDEFKYVPTKRLSLYVEESIKSGTQWAVFEHNNEATWAKIRQTVGAFLHSAWTQGALMGKKESEAFYVKCDRTTMTQSDIDNGHLNIEIGIAQTRPAEFMVIRIQQLMQPKP
jgi:Bacteriophage tail sheath protein